LYIRAVFLCADDSGGGGAASYAKKEDTLMKKALSLLLALTMIIGLFPATLAVDEAPVAEPETAPVTGSVADSETTAPPETVFANSVPAPEYTFTEGKAAAWWPSEEAYLSDGDFVEFETFAAAIDHVNLVDTAAGKAGGGYVLLLDDVTEHPVTTVGIYKPDFGFVLDMNGYTISDDPQDTVPIFNVFGTNYKYKDISSTHTPAQQIFKIKNGTIDNIFLNEACSSGCGSFLQTFAAALGYSNDEFDNLALFADNPVNLGSRCTVFMNSSVKQAQKDGASIENISAGLSISVVKNALYKVIRASSASALGEHIVVQGGTFINESVLRAFELETGSNVTRPAIAGLMGAYGAALYAKKKYPADTGHTSTVLTADELKVFEHKVSAITCKGCQNACRLTINSFNDGRKFIGGNRCEKPLIAQNGGKLKERHNLYECKRELISSYKNFVGELETIHIPLGLNMYEMYPFWYTFFKTLGFGVANSGMSTRKIYIKGQNTIPSDTICYPAKLIHGHIETLLEDGAKHIFYPCLSYNFDEGLGDNNYNCPVVAYYPEVISSNMKSLKDVHFIKTYIGIHRRKEFPAKMLEMLQGEFPQYSARLSLKDVKRASDAAYDEYYEHMKRIRKKGKEYVELAKTNGLPLIILCGRPYHIDPEINHGIDNLICDLNAVIVSEDGISDNVKRFPTTVLNQWTYHSRLYAAAKYVCESDYDKINLIQLVSFGCGVDAITTDEVRKILEEKDKIYTQIKIDEITNLGAVNIRVRSLFSALGLNE